MNEIKSFLKQIFRGIGQIMFQNNAITGLLFLVGITYNSWLMGIGTLLGVLISTTTAIILKYDKKEINDGLYGFNGALVGLAMLFFFEISIVLIIFTILASIFSTIIMNFMQKKKLAPYTFPFIIMTWIAIFITKFFSLVTLRINLTETIQNLDIITSISYGVGQVMFQASMITGIIFLIAILINSRISTLYAVAGSVLGMLTALLLSLPMNLINLGIFGFNAVLCAIALGERKVSSIIYVTLAIILSVIFMHGMNSAELISLTFPFVLSTWIIIGIKKISFKTHKE